MVKTMIVDEIENEEHAVRRELCQYRVLEAPTFKPSILKDGGRKNPPQTNLFKIH